MAGISRSIIRRILNDDIGTFPYKIQMLQTQSRNNNKIAKYFSQKIEDDVLDVMKVQRRPKQIYLSGFVTKQNMLSWALEKQSLSTSLRTVTEIVYY